jgi:hypothetical protein
VAHGEIETHHPGFLGAQDTYYVGYIKGVGKIYQQTVIDTYAKYGKTPMQTRNQSFHLAKEKLLSIHYQNVVSLPLSDERETSSAGGATR